MVLVIYRTCLKSILPSCLIILLMFNLDVVAVDEDIPQPIIERGILSWVAINAMKLFREVDIIEIHGLAVQKTEITVKPGTVIAIENKDQTNHRLIFQPAPGNDLMHSVSSSVIGPGQLWGAEFADTGTYPYYCSLHPEQVHGEIRVVQTTAL